MEDFYFTEFEDGTIEFGFRNTDNYCSTKKIINDERQEVAIEWNFPDEADQLFKDFCKAIIKN